MTVGIPSELPSPERRIFCNRTLNLRAIRAVGFDMDYTLIHYRTVAWERRAYEHVRQRLMERGWPVENFEFDPDLITLGLALDLELGNIVKTNRFGYVKRASHGTQMLDFADQRETYERVRVELSDSRWVFINTLFGLSEACMYAQLVHLFDEGRIEEAHGYEHLYRIVRANLDETHMEGELKAEIIAEPDRFVDIDPDLPLALLDLRHAGKTIMLITNSEWSYTKAMMSYAFDPLLPEGNSWRDLFHVVIVAARKPFFFTQQSPFFEIVDEEGLLRPFVGRLQEGGLYAGGSAAQVEHDLGLPGEDILYVGDHIFADVHISKTLSRWRTALVLRELEAELADLEAFRPTQAELTRLMGEKEVLEHHYSLARIALQRLEKGYGPRPVETAEQLRRRMQELRAELVALDAQIAPLAKKAGRLLNQRWGPLMRAGNDKSNLARQVERYSDIYMSRVSNLLRYTPFVYCRSPRGSLPHDSGPAGGVQRRDELLGQLVNKDS